MKLLLIIILTFHTFLSHAQLADNPNPTDTEIQLSSMKNPIEILRLGQSAFNEKNYAGFELAMKKLVELRPMTPAYQYKLAEAYALNDKKTEAFNTLIQLQKQGLYFDIANNVNFQYINKYPVFKYIKDNMDISGEHYGEGIEVFNIDKSFSGLLYESIAYDGNSQAFLLGSLRDGSVIKIAANGQISTLIPPSSGDKGGPWSINDLAVDENNDLLWVASSSMTQFAKFTKENLGSAGVFKYQLSTGKLLKSYLLPEDKKPHLITSLDLTHDGVPFFLETYKSSILKIDSNKDSMDLIFSSPLFSSLKSLAVDAKGKNLFFNDYELGLVGMDVESSKFYTLGNPETLNTTGVSDVIFNDSSLYLIQNGISPQRVLRLDLSPDLKQVIRVLPLEASHPKFNYPSYGIVLGDHIYYIANSQMPKATHLGGLLKDKEWNHMYVMRSEKNYQSKENAEYNKLIEEHKQKMGSD